MMRVVTRVTKTAPGSSGRSGMTLIEVLIAMLIFGTVMAGSIGFMAAQNSAFTRGAERMTVLQNLRYALQTIEMNVKTLGTNLAQGQPGTVYAGGDVLAFNADYATNIANDPSAVFRELGAPDAEVMVLPDSLSIPNSGGYEYADGGTGVFAETVVLFFEGDSTTARDDDFVLYRQVNQEAPEIIARHLLRVDTIPFFRFHARRDFPSAPPTIEAIPDSALPQSALDPRADSIRGVRVTLAATNGLPGPDERTAEVSRLIRMANAGVPKQKVCGDEPILGSVDFVAALGTTAGGDDAIDLTWDPAVDEGGGETDVIRYVLWRRQAGSTDWGAPFLSIPSGEASYLYQDEDLSPGATYEYSLAAQDCTPELSGTTLSGQVTVP